MDLRPLHLPAVLSAFAGAVAAFVPAFLANVGDELPGGETITAFVLAAGAMLAVAAVVRERGRRGAAAERRRIARDLHDGVTQELAFLVTQANLLSRARPDVDGLERLEAAAQRALDETRIAIGSLIRNASQTLAVAVEEAAGEVAHREGVKVEFHVDRTIDVAPETRDEIVRIVREATTNAIRHGRATMLRIVLSRAKDGIRIEIVDDGLGFDASVSPDGRGRFGLVSMNERARAVGGDLRVVSQPGAGTRVEVTVR